MKKLVFFALAAATLLAGCNTVEPEYLPQENKTVLKVGINNATKTHMGDADGAGNHKVYWSNGDQIAVNGVESEALTGLSGDDLIFLPLFLDESG